MALLAETYLNCSVNFPLEADREELAVFLQARAKEVFSSVYGITGDTYVETENGSLKVWMQAAAALSVAVAGYGEFRSGIDYLVSDAQKFSETMREIFLETGVKESSIDVFQRRLGVVGRIRRILVQIERLERYSYYDAAERHAEYDRLKALLFEVIVELDNAEDRALLINNLPEPVVREAAEHQIPQGKFPRSYNSPVARPEDWDAALTRVEKDELRLDGRPALLTHQPAFGFDVAAGRVVPLKARRPRNKIRPKK